MYTVKKAALLAHELVLDLEFGKLKLKSTFLIAHVNQKNFPEFTKTFC